MLIGGNGGDPFHFMGSTPISYIEIQTENTNKII